MLLAASLALANGLTTHVTISEDALTHLPEGELATLLQDPEAWFYIQNGTQFPDGGYPLGEAYAETAHWEPFQDRYHAWIRDTYGPDFDSEEAQQHVAYLFGMSSHGMADQVFDSLYMERARVYDAASDWANTSMDTATDVACGQFRGGQDTLTPFVFTDAIVPLMEESGVTVSAETLEQGQLLTAIAITFGRTAGADPSQQELYRDQYPWAYDHLYDASVPGHPGDEARVVARYWEVRWAQLRGEAHPYGPVIASFPEDGGYGHPTDSTSVESTLTVVFEAGLAAAAVNPASFSVRDADGNDYPLKEPWVFYGHSSHVVHLRPLADWPTDTDFVLRVEAGVPYFAGEASEVAEEIAFSTKPPPAEPEAEAAVFAGGGGCSTAGGLPVGLLAGLGALGVGWRRGRRG